MKYINTYNNLAAHDADTNRAIENTVSYIKDVGDIIYNPYLTVIPFQDPLVGQILFDAGLIANPTYSTKEELALITDDGFAVYDAPNDLDRSIFYNTSVTSLNELQYFKGLTFLGQRYFYGSEIVSIIIPDGITYLGDECFSECSSLTSVTLESITPPTLDSYIFDSTVQKIYVPSSSVASYKSASGWIEFASKIFPIE